MRYEAQDDYEPVAHLAGYPLHLATLLAVIHSALLLVCTLVIALGGGAILDQLTFSVSGVLAGKVWQLFTYAFIHIPSSPFALVFFALEMYFGLFVFGREVEKFLGRKTFGLIYLALTLFTPVLILALSFISSYQPTLLGSSLLHSLIFVVFATIYPNAQVFFGIPAKWIVGVIAAGYGLFCLAAHQWGQLTVTWASMLAAYFSARLAGVGDGFDLLGAIRSRFPQREPATPARPKTKPLSRPHPTEDEATMESVDAVLEKISQQGLGSLTAGERATLERARATLLNKGKK